MIFVVNCMKQVCKCCQNVKFTWMDGTQMIIIGEHLVMSKYNLDHPWIRFRV